MGLETLKYHVVSIITTDLDLGSPISRLCQAGTRLPSFSFNPLVFCSSPSVTRNLIRRWVFFGIGVVVSYAKPKCTTLSLFNKRWCMGKQFCHLDHQERTLIYRWRKERLSLREMARRLRRSHSSISRELRRNRWCGQLYFPRGAQILSVYRLRLRRRAKRERLKSQQVRNYVQQKLLIGWTPELIAGRLQRKAELPSVCNEDIYQYIYCCAPSLIRYLPRHHPKQGAKLLVL